MKYRRALVLPQIPRIVGKSWCAKMDLKHHSESEDVSLYWLKTFQTIGRIVLEKMWKVFPYASFFIRTGRFGKRWAEHMPVQWFGLDVGTMMSLIQEHRELVQSVFVFFSAVLSGKTK